MTSLETLFTMSFFLFFLFTKHMTTHLVPYAQKPPTHSFFLLHAHIGIKKQPNSVAKLHRNVLFGFRKNNVNFLQGS